MDSRDFCYWLQGFIEISGLKTLSESQLQIIKDHLNLVFVKETPIRQIGFEAAKIENLSSRGCLTCSSDVKTYC